MSHAFEMVLTTLRIAWRLVMPIAALAILIGTFSRHSAPSVGAEAPRHQPVVLKNEGETIRIIARVSDRENLPHIIFQTSSGQEAFSINFWKDKSMEIIFLNHNGTRASFDPSGERPFFFSTHGPRADTVVKVLADGSTDVVVGGSEDANSVINKGIYAAPGAAKPGNRSPAARP